MDVLVTGGAGFVGSNLVRCLVASGDRVTVLDDPSNGSVDAVERLSASGGAVEVIRGDVRDRGALDRAMRGVEVVYHLAATPPEAGPATDPGTAHEVIVGGTLNVLLAARDAGVRRVVNASSSLVYGEAPVPMREDHPGAPRTPFAVSTLAADESCRGFTRTQGLDTVTLRFFNVFGPWHDPASHLAGVVPRFITRMVGGRSPAIFGDGTQTRDLTYVANVIQALVLAASAGSEAAGEIVNVGSGEGTSLLELVEILNELLGTTIEPGFGPAAPGDVRHSEASIAKAELLLGYRPLVGLRQGLELTLEWITEWGWRRRHVDLREERISMAVQGR